MYHQGPALAMRWRCAGDALALRHDLLSSGALKCSTQPYCRCLAGDMLIVAPVMHYMSLKCDSVSSERTCTATSLLSTNSSLLAAGATKYPAGTKYPAD